MKIFTVNNLSLQFNQYDDNDSPHELVAQKFIDSLNEHIKSFSFGSCPHIMSIQVGPEQIHVEDKESIEDGFITEILQHQVEWWYEDDSIMELPELEEEHIEQMIIDGNKEGQLVFEDKTHNSTGWWKII